MSDLTGKQKEFCRQYALLNNAVSAYRVAYNAEKMNEKSIRNEADKLLTRPDIAQFVAERHKRAEFKFEITEQMVLAEWWKIATADVNQLMRHRRVNCRYCNGTDHFFQWRDADEWVRACASEELDAKQQKRDPVFPDCGGGFNFNATVPPRAGCPKCDGEGLNDVWLADTDTLEGAARLLFAGVKTTNNGIEIKTRDQDAALANIARFLGMYHDRQPGKANGNPVVPSVTVAVKTPGEAAKIYKDLMG